MTDTLVPRTLADVAEATPATRDRYVDFLRVGSLAVVVLGHWLMAAVSYQDGRLGTTNVLRVNEWGHVLTWAFQIMPVFFFVGGFSNAASWAAARRDGVAYSAWLHSRVRRLVRPAAVFAVVWAGLAAAAGLLDAPDATLRTANKVVALPLWFLAVYLVVVAAAPAMIAAHRRLGVAVAVLLAVGAGAVDMANHALGIGAVGWVNFGLVWLLAHQLGVLWRDGSLTRRPSTPWLVAGAGLAGLLVLTQLAGYPVSLVGGVGQARTNTHPPSLAIVGATLLQVGLAVALRRPVDRLLTRPRAWAAVVAANSVAMTVYLWHLTALVVVSLVLLPAGLFPQPDAGSAAWWAWRPAWVAALVLALVPLVGLFAGVERGRHQARPAGRSGRKPTTTAAAAALSSAAGMTVLALRGFAPAGQPLDLPLVGLGLLAAGPVLFRLAAPPYPSPSTTPLGHLFRQPFRQENTMKRNVARILAESASRVPDHPAVVLGDTSLDYATLDDLARRFAGGLRGLGIAPGDRVALLLPNVPHFSVAYFGCHYAAAPVVPLNVLLSAAEIAHQLSDSGATAIVVWEDFAARAAEAAASVPGCCHVVVARADLADVSAPRGCSNLAAVVLSSEPVAGVPPTTADDTAVVLYTSGTTGRPKGAELTHGNVLSNTETCGRQVFPLGNDTVALGALPLFHAFGQTVVHNAVLQAGGTVVLLPRWDAGRALELIERHRVTFLGGVPTMYLTLLHHPAAEGVDVSSLRLCVSGGAPLPPEVMAAVDRRFGIDLLEGYGLSETSPVATFNLPGRPKRPGSIGMPIPGVELRLVDQAGRVVADPGTPGEICVRGPNVMKGYHGDPAATAEAIRDGWFRTGDIGTRDADGYYRVVDRKKDMILRGGFNVYPREVEDVLHAIPAVREAAVVGVPDERFGEDVVAFVVLDPATETTAADLRRLCRERLAAYKYPRRIEIVDSLPHGPTGKVLKRELRATATGSQATVMAGISGSAAHA